MIYDVNGFIAGMHSVISKESADESPFEFEKSAWYRIDESLGYEAFVTTAFFVDPATICEGGMYVQFWQMYMDHLLDKLYENGVTLREQSRSKNPTSILSQKYHSALSGL